MRDTKWEKEKAVRKAKEKKRLETYKKGFKALLEIDLEPKTFFFTDPPKTSPKALKA